MARALAVQMARAFKAFVRAKKVKTPAQLLRLFLYCGLDKTLREVAGTLTALYESMTDQAVAERSAGARVPVVHAAGQSDAAAHAPPVRRGDPAHGAALCGDRRQQYSSPRRHRHRSSPPYRDGLVSLQLLPGFRQRCPHGRNAQAFHLGARRCCRWPTTAAMPIVRA